MVENNIIGKIILYAVSILLTFALFRSLHLVSSADIRVRDLVNIEDASNEEMEIKIKLFNYELYYCEVCKGYIYS